MSVQHSYKGIIAILCGGVAIASAAIFMRLAPVAPPSAAFWRLALSVPVFLLIAYIGQRNNKESLTLSPTLLWKISLVGAWFAADLFFWHWSVAYTTVANATLLANLASVFTAVAGYLFFGERFSARFLIGLALALMGAGFLIGQNAAYAPEYLLGDGMGIITALALTGYLITAAKTRPYVSTNSMMLGSAVVGAVLLLPAAIIAGGKLIPDSLEGWGPLLGLALITHVMGQGLIVFGLAHVSAAHGAVGLLIQPVVAALLAWLWFGEMLGMLHIVGGILILTGIMVTQSRVKKTKALLSRAE